MTSDKQKLQGGKIEYIYIYISTMKQKVDVYNFVIDI